MRIRRAAIVAAFAAALSACSGSHATTTPTDRPATDAERTFCEQNFDTLGPVTGDCSKVPLQGEILEDDPWGRWDCRTMGNHVCGDQIFFRLGDQLVSFSLNDPNRPGCFVEPSNTPEGFEVIYRPVMSQGDQIGFEVRCPN